MVATACAVDPVRDSRPGNRTQEQQTRAGPIDRTSNRSGGLRIDPGIEPSWRQRLRIYLLDLDSRLDFGLFRSALMARELFERFRDFMDRFHVAGWRRWLVVEPLSEMATMGMGGLLLALALAVPAFRETADEDWLKKSELAVVFLDRYGNEVGSRGIKHSNSVALAELPDHLIKAVLATEDRRFYEHFGIDVPGTFRAVVTNARAGGVVQGGSSITQQLAKNLFLSNERTIERKVKEAFLALWLETRLTKNEILKLYLDRAYMGGGAFGVDAAAQFYFGKSARDVNLAEAAMLAGLFKAPTKFAPHINLPAARARANVVLDNLVEAGFMTEGQVFGARRNPATAIDRRDEGAPGYYLDWAFDEMKKLVDTFPRTIADRAFVVRTALDPGLQRAAEDAIENSIRQYRPRLPRQAGGRRGGRSRRRGARHGGRPRLQHQPVQPRDRRAAPAGLLVQALCLRHRADERLQADLGRGRRPGLHRQLVPAELRPQLFGRGHADPGDHPLDQRHSGQAVDRAGQRQCQGRPRQDHRDRAPHGHPLAAAGHALAADRRRRGQRARAHRRLCDLPEPGQGGGAARDPRGALRHRRDHLALRPRRQEAGPGDPAAGRLRHGA